MDIFKRIDGKTDVVIPEEYEGVGVLSFTNQGLTSVKFSKNLLWIDNGAFHKNELKEVILEDNVQYIGKTAFANNKIEKLHLSKGLREIDELAFLYNELKEVVIPARVFVLGANAFVVNNITKITFEGTVHEKGENVFASNGPNGDSPDLPHDQEWSGTWELINGEWIRTDLV